MKFGVREICDVVLKAKVKDQEIGNKKFAKDEPVIYFDTLKTSSMEGAVTTVYAQGGRGNSRLVAWEGERTVTFTMEDALISPLGFMILSGAGLTEGSTSKPIKVHATQRVAINEDDQTDSTKATFSATDGKATIPVGQAASSNEDAKIYVMALDDNGDIIGKAVDGSIADKSNGMTITATVENIPANVTVKAFLVDYYVEKAGAQQIDIEPGKFGGNFYLEASTLFRNTQGKDMPAEFIIPNCKIQSNFTFTMASSGDPSSFTFTMDAFPDYTKFDPTKKVLAAIQIIES